MRLIAISVAAALAAAGSAGTVPPDGFIYFVNASGQPLTLSVDGASLQQLPHMKIVGYPVPQGEHLLHATTGSLSAELSSLLSVKAVAQDGRGRNYWCFVAMKPAVDRLAIRQLEVSRCAQLISAGAQDNPT